MRARPVDAASGGRARTRGLLRVRAQGGEERAHRDELGLRLFAQAAADLAPTLLIALNDERIVRDRRDALDAALTVAVAPRSYRVHLVVCLGLSSASGAEVRAAVGRLGSDLLAFIREHASEVDPQPELPRYLGDGTLESHLRLNRLMREAVSAS